MNETEKGVQGIGAGVQGLARELGGTFQRGPPPPPTVSQVFEGRVPLASSPQPSGEMCASSCMWFTVPLHGPHLPNEFVAHFGTQSSADISIAEVAVLLSL